jgi:hypothetical protein
MAQKVMRPLLLLTCVVGIGLGSDRADAGNLATYSDSASFQAATTGLTDVNFNGIAPSGSFVNSAIPPGYTDAATGTNFTFLNSNGGDINVTSSTYYSTVFPDDFLNSSVSIAGNATELITLPSDVTAVSFYFSTFETTPLVFTLSNGDSFTDSGVPGFFTQAFLGFTDSAAFTSITISAPGSTSNGVLLLDFEFGTAVPEPSSLTLLAVSASCVALLVGYRRRQRMGA